MNRGGRTKLAVPVGPSDHVSGPIDAAVTLVEYGDYECPHCGLAYPIVKEIQRGFRGRLRFVFRNFPLAEAHPHAQHAAEAAEGAAAANLFWEMHGVLFEHQQELDDRDLIRYATELGLDERRFGAELAKHAHAARVREDVLGGIESGVRGTPTFFINGVRHEDSWDLRTLSRALEAVGALGGTHKSGRATNARKSIRRS